MVPQGLWRLLQAITELKGCESGQTCCNIHCRWTGFILIICLFNLFLLYNLTKKNRFCMCQITGLLAEFCNWILRCCFWSALLLKRGEVNVCFVYFHITHKIILEVHSLLVLSEALWHLRRQRCSSSCDDRL